MTDNANARAAYIEGLRQLADVLESTPHLPLPDTREVSWYLFGDGPDGPLGDDEQRRRMVEIVRMLPGSHDKQVTGDLFRLRGSIAGLRTQVVADRTAVCRRVVTGTREVAKTVPAPDAPMVEITETVEDVEWVCEPILPAVSA